MFNNITIGPFFCNWNIEDRIFFLYFFQFFHLMNIQFAVIQNQLETLLTEVLKPNKMKISKSLFCKKFRKIVCWDIGKMS